MSSNKNQIISLAGIIALSSTLAILSQANPLKGTRFQYMEKAMRVEIIASYCKQLEENYAGWDLKKDRLKIDPKKICNDAIQTENQISDIDLGNALSEAAFNIAFYNRAAELSAKFQDSHLRFTPSYMYNKLTVVLPFEFVDFKGKIIVTSINQKLLAYLADTKGLPNLKELPIKKGDQIIEVDEKPIEDFVSKLSTTIGESTPDGVRKTAIQYLSKRSNHLPMKSRLRLKFASKDNSAESVIDIPVAFYGDGIPEQRQFANEFDWVNVEGVFREYNPKRNKWVRVYNPPIYSDKLIQKEIYEDENYEPILAFAKIVKDGKAYTYIQMKSFYFQGLLSPENDSSAKKSFSDVLEDKIQEANRDGSRIILDLRDNPGGALVYVVESLGLLTSQKEGLISVPRVFRLTESLRLTFQNMPYETLNSLPNKRLTLLNSNPILEFEKALKNKQKYVQIENQFMLTSSNLSHYSLPLAVMITHNCVSACDAFVAQLKKRKSTVILGTPTAGTGMGFYTTSSMSTKFKDRFGAMISEIPNQYFGSLGIRDPKVTYLNSLENIPTTPHTLFEADPSISEEDIETQWLVKAIEQHQKFESN